MPNYIDEHQDSEGTNFGFGQNAVIRYRGQIFTPNLTADLVSIGFSRNKGSQGIKVYIDTVTSNAPTHAVGSELYSFTITNANVVTGYNVYTLPVPLKLTSGVAYCFYLAPWNTSGDVYADDYQDCHGVASAVTGLELTNNNGSWSTENLNMHMATYMEVYSSNKLAPTHLGATSGAGIANPSNVFTSNDAWADITDITSLADVDTFGDFGIPATATIVGIEMEGEGHYTGAGVNRSVGLLCIGANGHNKTLAAWDISTITTDAVDVVGTIGNCQGGTMTPADFNSPGFTLEFGGNSLSVTSLNIDQMKIIVFYTMPVAVGSMARMF